MTCDEVRDALSPYLDGVGDATAIDQHVAACAPCAAGLREMKELRGLLRAFEEDEALATDPTVLARRVREAAERPVPPYRPGSLAWILVLCAVAAFVAVVFEWGKKEPAPRVKAPPVVEPRIESGTLTLTLAAPDAALFDRITTFFKEWPGTVEERRSGDGLTIEVTARGPASPALSAFQKRISGFLDSLQIRNGSWEWRTDR